MRSQSLACWAISGSSLLSITCAAPSLNFPISSQVPPVALTAQQYSFTFEKSTFLSALPLSYSLRNEPSWLRFDGKTRTFFGTVAADTTGPVVFDLIASSSDGSTTSEVTLFTTDQRGPQLGEAVLPQLGEAGPVSAPASLLLYPLQPFSISLSHETFVNTAENTNFYATSADNSPLPSWLQFDSRSLEFSGRAPPLLSPTSNPQDYGVRIIASDVPGFAQVVTNFQIVIGFHVLAFSTPSQVVEVSPGLVFQSQPLRRDLMIDGRFAKNIELASVISDAPEWAEIDTENILLRGTPPAGAKSQSVLIQVTDIFGNTANTSIRFVTSNSEGGLFNARLPAANASIGQDFRYTLAASVLLSDDVQVTADLTNVSSWMTYDATSRTLNGFVPNSLQPDVVSLMLNATLGATTDQEILILKLLRHPKSPESSQTSEESTSSTEQALPRPTSGSDQASRDQKRKLAILLGVTLPLSFLLGFVGLLLYCCWTRQRKQSKAEQASDMGTSWPATHDEAGQTDKGTLKEPPTMSGANTPTSPPRIELPWAPDSLRMSRGRSSRLARSPQTPVTDSDWGDLVMHETPEAADPTKGTQDLIRNDSDTLEALAETGDWTPFVRSSSAYYNYSRKRTPLQLSQAKVRKLSTSSNASKSLRTLSTRSVGLPGRLSGAGHGAGGPGPPDATVAGHSWRNNTDSFTRGDARSTLFDLSSFPEPPSGQKETGGFTVERTMKSSVRLVSSSSGHSGSLAEQRQQWVRDRARDRCGRASAFSPTTSSISRSSRTRPRPLTSGSYSKRRTLAHSWSQSAAIGATDGLEYAPAKRNRDLSFARHPSTLRRALSTVSSGRLNSIESKSNSSWVDDLVEDQDEQGRRRWVALDKPLQQSHIVSDAEPPEPKRSKRCSLEKNAVAEGLAVVKDNIPDGVHGASTSARRWRLGGSKAKRPVSVDEGELQRSFGSRRGNLAFV